MSTWLTCSIILTLESAISIGQAPSVFLVAYAILFVTDHVHSSNLVPA